jgi:signal transduction histidine kinase
VDIHAILRDALLMVEAEARDKRQSIACDLCPVMPSSMADPTRLRQGPYVCSSDPFLLFLSGFTVFWNLLRNAVKFTHRGGSIWIRTQVEGTFSDPCL